MNEFNLQRIAAMEAAFDRTEAAVRALMQALDEYETVKVDIDRCRAIAQEYDCMTIPVVILFENGKEVRRITSAVYSEEDILKFVEGR